MGQAGTGRAGASERRARSLKVDVKHSSNPAWIVAEDFLALAAAYREAVEALVKAAVALRDLGACQDAECREANCLRALPNVEAVLAKAREILK